MEVLTNSLAASNRSAANGPARLASGDVPDASRRGMHLAILLLILVIGAGLRFGLWTLFEGQSLHIEDEQDYNRLACNLVEYGEFAFEPGQPTSIRPPLDPAVVAGIYRLFGLENYQAVRLMQARRPEHWGKLGKRTGAPLLPDRVSAQHASNDY